MDDNKGKSDENQPSGDTSQNKNVANPFGTIEVINQPVPPQPMPQVEEVSDQVETAAPEDVTASTAPPPNMSPPPIYEDNRHKYMIIGGVAIFFIMILGLLLSLILRGGAKQANVTLTYWGLWEEQETIQPLIAEYQRAHPNVKIEYTKMAPKDQYKEKLIQRSKNGKGPDIFRFHNTWLPQISDVATYIPSSIMSNVDFEKTFYPAFKQDLLKDNHYYGIPLYIDGLVLVYNETWFKNSNITTPPNTWDDLLSIGEKLNPTKSGGKLMTGAIALGTAENVEHFSDALCMMILQNGATLSNLSTQEAAGALETYRYFAEGDVKYWDESMPNSVTAFAQEKVAMIIVPVWEILTIHSMNPDLKMKVVPIPYIPGRNKRISLSNYWVEGVSKYSRNQIEAWKFLKFLSEKEQLAKLYQNQKKVRLFGTPYSRVDMASLLAQDQYLGAVIQTAQSDSFKSLPCVDRTYDEGLNDRVVGYLKNAVNATIQGADYSEALQTAQSGISQLYDQYGIKK